jgi:peptidoglycan/LPS O-acetylase OafA/YrhL
MSSIPEKHDSYLVQLDGLRFFAVAIVLFDHWLTDINEIPFGSLGVNLFFVLSGFLITRILLTSKSKNEGQTGGLKTYLKRFYIRRTLRIFPIYYLSILILWLLNDPSVRGKAIWSIVYATNIYVVYHNTWFGVIDHFWSLAVEEQFYIFFPLFIFFIPRRFVVPFFIALIGMSVGIRLILYLNHANWKIAYVTMFTCLDSFGLGSLIAYLFLYNQTLFKKLFSNHYWLIVSFIAVVLNLYLGYKYWWDTTNSGNERFIPSVFFFFLIGGAIVGYKGWLKWLLENPVSNYLGRISYGIYIYHNFVYNYYHKIKGNPIDKMLNAYPILNDNYVLRFAFLFIVTVAIASASWFLIEKPINALKDKLA